MSGPNGKSDTFLIKDGVAWRDPSRYDDVDLHVGGNALRVLLSKPVSLVVGVDNDRVYIPATNAVGQVGTGVTHFWQSASYRVRQFHVALRARVSTHEYALVAQVLTPAEQRLFAAMPVYDQRHCLDVYGTLHAAGYRDPLLLRAALFHDCGKVDDDGTPMSLLWYSVITLMKKYGPWLYQAAAIQERGVLRAVHLYATHAWRGATMAAAAGSPPEVVMTLRHYHDPAPTGRAATLQWADEQH